MTNRNAPPQTRALAVRTEKPGQAVVDGLEDPKQARKTARLIRRSAREGWVVGPEAKKKIIKKAESIAIDTEDERLFAELLRGIVQADKTRFDQLVEAHRIERLESGQSTENHAVASLTPDIIAAALGRVNDTQAGG